MGNKIGCKKGASFLLSSIHLLFTGTSTTIYFTPYHHSFWLVVMWYDARAITQVALWSSHNKRGRSWPNLDKLIVIMSLVTILFCCTGKGSSVNAHVTSYACVMKWIVTWREKGVEKIEYRLLLRSNLL